MKTRLLAIALLSWVSLTVAANNEVKEAPSYQLWWSDEFDTDGPPNAEYWSFEHGFARNHEDQWYQKENVVCKDGYCIITCKKERKDNPWYVAGSTDWKTKRRYIDYTSASMTTNRKVFFTFGRMEVRAKIPTAGGAWPAIWLLGNNSPYEWPSCGEIDVMEYYRGKILANACHGNDKQWSAVWNSLAKPITDFIAADPEWADKFHVWRMDWDREAIKIYIDDELINSIDLSSTVNGKLGEGTNPFHADQYVLLNLALGGDNGGAIDDSAFPIEYVIDYVRIYR